MTNLEENNNTSPIVIKEVKDMRPCSWCGNSVYAIKIDQEVMVGCKRCGHIRKFVKELFTKENK